MSSHEVLDVLIVDDDPLMRSVLVADLNEVCRVEALGLDQPPLQTIARLRPRILITDLTMSPWSGEEVARFAMSISHPPVIFLMSGNEGRLHAARHLADRTFLKPFVLRTLRDSVVSHLAHRRETPGSS